MNNLTPTNQIFFGSMPFTTGVPGLSAADVQRQNTIFQMLENSRQLLNKYSNGKNGTASSIWNGGGQTQSQPKQEASQKNINTNNFSSFWSDIDETKSDNLLKQLQIKEIAIDKAQTKFDEATKAGDGAEQSKWAKELHTLRESFKSLEKQLSNGTLPSVAYGKGSFKYNNISNEELKQFKERNVAIQMKQAELAEKEKEIRTQSERIMKAKQEVAAQGGNPEVDWKSKFAKEDLAAMDRYKDDIKELREEISTEIDNLSSYIKEAGKTDKSSDYYVFTENKTKEDAAKKVKAAGDRVAGTVINAMFDDKKLKTKEAFAEELGKLKDEDFGGYTPANFKEVAEFLREAGNGKDKDKFKEYITSPKFLNDVRENALFADEKNGNQNLAILMQLVDEIAGLGQFEEAAKATEDKVEWASDIEYAKNWKSQSSEQEASEPPESETAESGENAISFQDIDLPQDKNLQSHIDALRQKAKWSKDTFDKDNIKIGEEYYDENGKVIGAYWAPGKYTSLQITDGDITTVYIDDDNNGTIDSATRSGKAEKLAQAPQAPAEPAKTASAPPPAPVVPPAAPAPQTPAKTDLPQDRRVQAHIDALKQKATQTRDVIDKNKNKCGERYFDENGKTIGNYIFNNNGTSIRITDGDNLIRYFDEDNDGTIDAADIVSLEPEKPAEANADVSRWKIVTKIDQFINRLKQTAAKTEDIKDLDGNVVGAEYFDKDGVKIGKFESRDSNTKFIEILIDGQMIRYTDKDGDGIID